MILRNLITFIYLSILLSCRLVHAQSPRITTSDGHSFDIIQTDISKDGKTLVTRDTKGFVKIWDIQSRRLLKTLNNNTWSSFSPNDRYLSLYQKANSESAESIGKIWDRDTDSLEPDTTAANSSWSLDSNTKIISKMDEGHQHYLVYDIPSNTIKKGFYYMQTDPNYSIRFFGKGLFQLTDQNFYGCLLNARLDTLSTYMGTIWHMNADVSKYFLNDSIYDVATGRSLAKIDGDFIGFHPTNDYYLTEVKDTVTRLKLWDKQFKKVFEVFTKDYFIQTSFSKEGTQLITLERDKVQEKATFKLRDLKTGKELYTYHESGDSGSKSTKIDHAYDNVFLLTCGKMIKVLNTKKNTVEILGDSVNSITDYRPIVNNDGRKFVSIFNSNSLKIWDLKEGGYIQSYKLELDNVHNDLELELSPDKRFLVAFNSGKGDNDPEGYGNPMGSGHLKLWDIDSAKLKIDEDVSQQKPFFLGTEYIFAENYGLKGVMTGEKSYVWETNTGRKIVLGEVIRLASNQAKFFVGDHQIFWGSSSGLPVVSFEGDPASLFNDEKLLLVKVRSGGAAIDTKTGKVLRTFLAETEKGELVNIKLSPLNNFVAGVGNSLRVWNSSTGSIFKSYKALGNELLFSSKDNFLVNYTYKRADQDVNSFDILLINLTTGKQVGILNIKQRIELVYFSQDEKYLIAKCGDQFLFWETNSGKYLKSFNGLVHFDWETKRVITSDNSINSIVDFESNETLISWVSLDNGDWLVKHPSGLFDASSGAMKSLYFVQKADVIEFNQLKDRYYEPGLWKKVMSGEKLRSVVGMKSIELPPDIRVGQVDEKGYLPIELVNKGGGIGEVTILINGKEAIADARPKSSNSKIDKLSLNVYIGNNKALIKGSDNFIAVKAWNEGHWVVSRAAGITYSIKGNEQAYKPAIHIITSGVSDYTGTELDLKYAAKDAEDVSKALQLGAKKLFGTDRNYVYNLTTSQPTNQYPTKANILKTFEKVSSVAHPLDVVVVYLSGHGINHGGQDGDWYYLTQDAYTSSSSAYNDPEIRRTSTLSSNELVELFKKVPALKQVLMIDACASGKVVENLMAKKDIESTTLRALDRMRDRTGLHIITGCTADAVSYEASKYGQGVLTYSLLEGIRGAALREDQFVDINKLFQYAHDRVPTLAEGIGGIQTPQVFSPQGGQSFDIGVLSDIEKKEIPIAKIRPVYIRSSFIDDDQLEDALQLGKKVDDALNEAASKGTGSSIIFVDVREYPEGCKLSGKYKQEGGIIKLKLRKKCEGKDETIEITGKTVEEVRNKIISSL